ncbi:MAG: cupin domain-containing protein [Solirubrobacteraceae bacterium]
MAHELNTPRRVVTGHDAEGRSVILSDGPAPRSQSFGDSTFHEIWTSTEMPVALPPVEPHEPTDRPLTVPPPANGTNLHIIDSAPGSRTPMHRTRTLDYGIVIAGRYTLILDDGTETELNPGDVVVQRGTNHAWLVTGEQPGRMAFVLVDGQFSDDLLERLPADVELFDQVLD